MGKKRCSKSTLIKNNSEFSVRDERARGFRSHCKICVNKYGKKYRNRKSVIHTRLVQRKARYAYEIGQLKKPVLCENCKEEKPLDRHHNDYKKPYNVKWFCRKCHQILHAKDGLRTIATPSLKGE